MKKLKLFLTLASALLILAACGSEPEIDVEATIAAGLSATQTAMPTATAVPTNTPQRTATAIPPTAVPPTEVPPTDVPPTEVPPTATVELKDAKVETEESGLATNPAGTFVITALGDGTRLFEVPADNFSIILPEEYEAVDPADSQMLQEALESTLTENPLFSSQQMAALATAGIKLYAVNTTSESLTGESPIVINIIRQELPIKFTVEEFTEANQSQLGQFLDLTSDVQTSYTQLGSHTAGILSYTANIPVLTGQTVEFANSQYLVIDPDDERIVYIVTVGMPLSMLDSLGVQALEVAETFRLISSP